MGAGKTTFYACHQNLPSGSVGPPMAQLQKAISVSGGVKVLIGQLGMTTISALILAPLPGLFQMPCLGLFQMHYHSNSGGAMEDRLRKCIVLM
jgi:hypothetical protein